MASAERQFGDLATQLLVQEPRRSTLSDTLLKYNDSLVRRMIREQRTLEALIDGAISAQTDDAAFTFPGDAPALLPLLYQTAANKRWLLAYHGSAASLKDTYWTLGGASIIMRPS